MTSKKLKIIAHRGSSAHAPENTRASFQVAAHAGVDFLECDIQLTKDLVPVLMHDATFHRITGTTNNFSVNDLTLEEVKRIDAGSWFDPKFSDQRILTLEEFLKMPKKDIGVMIDVKEETFTACDEAVVISAVLKKARRFIRRGGPILVGSLKPELLFCMRAFLPDQSLIPIINDLGHLEEVAEYGTKYVAIKASLAKKKLIQELHAKGVEVWAWTVDDKTTAKKLVDRGIDGLITNHPKKLMALK